MRRGRRSRGRWRSCLITYLPSSMGRQIQRDAAERTLQELERSIGYIVSLDSASFLGKAELDELLSRHGPPRSGKRWVRSLDDPERLLALVYSAQDPSTVASGILVKPKQVADEFDLGFLNTFLRVFNEDVRAAPDLRQHGELWQALRQAQFRRAIAKFSSFNTFDLTRLIQLVENSTSLRYEGQPFNYRLFLTKQEKWLQEPLGDDYMRFAEKIPYENALMSEKWIRAAVDGGEIGLVALRGHGFVAMFNTPTRGGDARYSFSPHRSLVALHNLLVAGTALFVVSEQGDVYFLLPNGATFLRTRGRWRHLNYSHLRRALVAAMTSDVANDVIRIALDLSYERKGALLVILDDDRTIDELVMDHRIADRANRPLRTTVKGMQLALRPHQRVIVSAAKSDGALVLSPSGRVLDVACMIGDPSPDALRALEFSSPQRFAGARSTAAWNASMYGTAIKISDDGPITVYRHGRLVSAIG